MRGLPRTGFLCAAIAIGAASAVLFGQAVNGSVVGSITDNSGAVVPSANVTITDVNTSVSHQAQTDGSGYYSFPDVAPGTYKVTVEKEGFATSVRSGVEVPVNATVRVDVALKLGQVTQQITVSETVPLLQTETAETGRTLTALQVADLPLGTNRNFQNLLLLTPGTNGSADFNHSRFFNAQNSLNTEVNGTSSLTNNFQIEGVNDNERTGLLQVYVPAAEALNEVNVTSSNYDAEQGTALGAVVNVIYSRAPISSTARPTRSTKAAP